MLLAVHNYLLLAQMVFHKGRDLKIVQLKWYAQSKLQSDVMIILANNLNQNVYSLSVMINKNVALMVLVSK